MGHNGGETATRSVATSRRRPPMSPALPRAAPAAIRLLLCTAAQNGIDIAGTRCDLAARYASRSAVGSADTGGLLPLKAPLNFNVRGDASKWLRSRQTALGMPRKRRPCSTRFSYRKVHADD